MTVPASDKVIGQSGHTTDHNSIAARLKQTHTVFNAVDGYGATGDGSTDDYVAITAALTAATGNGTDPDGAIVTLPPGDYITNTQIVIPNKVRLVGAGRSATRIKAGASFPVDTALVQIGSGTICFGNGPEDLTIDCNSVSGSIGIYSNAVNEQAGARRCVVTGFKGTGIKVDRASSGQAQNFILRDIEVYFSASAPGTAIGIDIDSTASVYGMRDITIAVEGSGTIASTKGITIDGISGHLSNIHVEGVETGIQVGATTLCGGIVISGISGRTGTTTVVEIANTAGNQDIALMGIVPNGATYSFNDLRNSRSSTFSCGLYMAGNGAVGQSVLLSDDRNVRSRLATVDMAGPIVNARTYNATTSGTMVVDPTAGNLNVFTLTGNVTAVTFPAGTTSQELLLHIQQDGTGGRTIAGWPVGVTWLGGVAPTISVGVNKSDFLRFLYTGADWKEIARYQNVS